MRKKIFLNGIVLFIATWILYVGIMFLVCLARGSHFDLLEKGITATICSIIIPLGQLMSWYNVFPRIKYLENNNIVKPSFKDVCSSMVDTPQGFDFTRLKNEIADKWVITFSNDVEKALKFRAKIGFSKSLDVAALLKYDSDAGKLYLDCFTLAGAQFDRARKMQKEIEKCLKLFEPTLEKT